MNFQQVIVCTRFCHCIRSIVSTSSCMNLFVQSIKLLSLCVVLSNAHLHLFCHIEPYLYPFFVIAATNNLRQHIDLGVESVKCDHYYAPADSNVVLLSVILLYLFYCETKTAVGLHSRCSEVPLNGAR